MNKRVEFQQFLQNFFSYHLTTQPHLMHSSKRKCIKTNTIMALFNPLRISRCNLRHVTHLSSSCLSSSSFLSPNNKTVQILGHRPRNYGTTPVRDYFMSKYVALGTSWPVESMADFLCRIHDTTGLPWWATITLYTVGMRYCCLLPAHIVSQKTSVKRTILWYQLDKQFIPNLRKAVEQLQRQKNWSHHYARNKFSTLQARLVKEKVEEYNCGAARVYVPFVLQVPVWITTSLAIRRLSSRIFDGDTPMFMDKFAEMSRGGIGFIPDLTASDATMILPSLVGGMFAANLVLMSNSHSRFNFKKSIYLKAFEGVFLTWAVVMVYVAGNVPSAVALYWLLSGSSGVAVTLTVMSPKVRDLAKIPEIPGETDRPYKRVYVNFTSKLKDMLKIK